MLLISCSQRKRQDLGFMPAIDRYDGPAFRVLRRYLRETKDPTLLVHVLSAEFGVISSRKSIPNYDRRMTAERARKMQKQNSQMLELIVRNQPFRELFICASTLYQQSFDGSILERRLPVRYAARGQGPKLASLHRWLRESSNG